MTLLRPKRSTERDSAVTDVDMFLFLDNYRRVSTIKCLPDVNHFNVYGLLKKNLPRALCTRTCKYVYVARTYQRNVKVTILHFEANFNPVGSKYRQYSDVLI